MSRGRREAAPKISLTKRQILPRADTGKEGERRRVVYYKERLINNPYLLCLLLLNFILSFLLLILFSPEDS